MTLPATHESLYAVLGVPERSATPEEIKQGYRAAAKATHPDKGGSPEAFARVQHAYGILSDPERRAKYDATGDDAEASPDNSAARMHSIIMGALDRAMGGDLDHNDIIGNAVAMLHKDVRDGHAANDTMRHAKKQFQKVRKRLKFGGSGPDLIDRTLADRIADIDRNIAGNEATMARVQEAADALAAGWSYEVDVMPMPQGWSTASAATGNWTFT